MITRDDGWVFSVGKKSGYYTSNPDEACLFVVPVDDDQLLSTAKPIITFLRSLSHWNRNGKNHLIIDTRGSVNKTDLNLYDDIKNVQFGSAMIASPFFETSLLESIFREGYDLLIPTFRFHEKSANLWPYLPYMMPVRREFLFSFQGVKIMNKEEIHSDPSPQRYHIDDDTINNSGMKGQSLQLSHNDQNLIHILEKVYKKDKESYAIFGSD
jgi:hypothetical protein